MILDHIYRSLRPALFRADPEEVHDRTIAVLGRISKQSVALRMLQQAAPVPNPRLRTTAFGLSFASPLGIAAGLDKNGVAFPALLALGFGQVEVGTITPRPQEGNLKPRVFRLVEDRALINRMGFPGAGVAEVVAQVAMLKRPGMIVGCNIGPNKVSVEAGTATEDLVACYRAVASAASYVAVNISSPNTPNLRELQRKSSLREMLAGLNEERRSLLSRPLLLKISPDLTQQELLDLIEVAIEANIDGLIAANSTIARPAGLRSTNRIETGGLSGAPLAPLAAQTVRRIASESGGTMPIIADGGIETGADVAAAIEAGATLVQTYTGFIYRGPEMAGKVQNELLAELDRRGIETIDELRASGA